MHMIILLLMMWMGSVYAQSGCDNKECSFMNSNLTEIPTDMPVDITKLNLANNSISSDKLNKAALEHCPNLTELNLSNNNIKSLSNDIFSGLSKLEVLILKENYITAVEASSFQGLENLKVLDLGYNQITELPTNILLPYKQLQELNLQNNSMANLDIKEALKDLKTPLNITLSGNPWNCSCSIINLAEWLGDSKVILEYEDITMCATPENMRNYTIKAILTSPDMHKCNENENPRSTTAATDSEDPKTPPSTVSNWTSSTGINGTAATPTTGNSWRFLVGVVVVGIVTILVILAAIKFPKWYDFLLSYNHHRLKEEDPYMFEEEFNVDFSMSMNDKSQEDETVVVFEQTHSFMPEEDGFIEDKYIDEKDMRAES